MEKTIPAISIIIPMYNVEKYIGDCLDSILAQTFKDYEVIAVDDGSTDKTCEIVESYLPRFEDKLQLIRSEKNSGGCVGIPRNIGIGYAIGEYLYFMDSDDALINNALEVLYTSAEKFGADVVHCERWIESKDDENFQNKETWKEMFNPFQKPVDEPIVMTGDLRERVKLFGQKIFQSMPWLSFARRDCIVKNDVKFPETRMSDDQFFDFEITCHAEKIVRIPDKIYISRIREDSVTREKLDVPKNIHRWTGALLKTIELLDNFMNRFDDLKNNSELKHAIFERFFADFSYHTLRIYSQIPAWQLDALIRRELNEIKDKTALTAFLFARMNVLNVQLMKAQNLLRQQPKEVQDFQRQNEIIQRQQAQIQQLQQQLRNVHDVFR